MVHPKVNPNEDQRPNLQQAAAASVTARTTMKPRIRSPAPEKKSAGGAGTGPTAASVSSRFVPLGSSDAGIAESICLKFLSAYRGRQFVAAQSDPRQCQAASPRC